LDPGLAASTRRSFFGSLSNLEKAHGFQDVSTRRVQNLNPFESIHSNWPIHNLLRYASATFATLLGGGFHTAGAGQRPSCTPGFHIRIWIFISTKVVSIICDP